MKGVNGMDQQQERAVRLNRMGNGWGWAVGDRGVFVPDAVGEIDPVLILKCADLLERDFEVPPYLSRVMVCGVLALIVSEAKGQVA